MPDPRTQSRPAVRPTRDARRRGFTLVELVVVLGIMILLMSLAVPALNLITGSRSIGGGINVLSSVVARARTAAIAAQEPRGVVLFRNNTGERSSVAVVAPPTIRSYSASVAYRSGDYVRDAIGNVFVALQDSTGAATGNNAFWQTVPPAAVASLVDLAAGADIVNLAPGVDAQVIIDSGAGGDDGLLSTGVIWFDGDGRLIRAPWALSMYGRIGQSAGSTLVGTGLYLDPALGGLSGDSGVGLVVFDRGDFVTGALGVAVKSDDTDHVLLQEPDAYNIGERDEELWVFANGTPLLVNRFNGTLVRAQ